MKQHTPEELREKIVKLQSIIMHVRNSDDTVTLIPLDEFSKEIRFICESTLCLPKTEALSIQPMLMKLRDNLIALTEDMSIQNEQKRSAV